jgi:alanine-glyoxylate transaminase/serine-glyoxylate transaminase/serine-pyruvate transaminase
MDRSVLDHRSPEFGALLGDILPRLRTVFGSKAGRVVVYPSSGTGAWEAALVNVLAPGDRVLSFGNGYFSSGFAETARHLGFIVDEIDLTWGAAIPPELVRSQLDADRGASRYRAVLVVHNETSTGVLSDLAAIRQAMDATGHDALLLVDAVSSLGSVPFLFDTWRVDVAITGSQKGLMLPPGLGILCIGPRALAAGERGGSARHFFDWRPYLRESDAGFVPYTPATSLLFGLQAALQILIEEEGLEGVFARHHRLASGVRAAVDAWGLRLLCEDASCASETLTAVLVPDGTSSTAVVDHAGARYGLALGVGLGQLQKRVFRIGHLGSLNELEVLGTLAGIELTFADLGMDVAPGSGVAACEQSFLEADSIAAGGARLRDVAAAAP